MWCFLYIFLITTITYMWFSTFLCFLTKLFLWQTYYSPDFYIIVFGINFENLTKIFHEFLKVCLNSFLPNFLGLNVDGDIVREKVEIIKLYLYWHTCDTSFFKSFNNLILKTCKFFIERCTYFYSNKNIVQRRLLPEREIMFHQSFFKVLYCKNKFL